MDISSSHSKPLIVIAPTPLMRPRHKAWSRKGATLVEFAFVVPVFFTLMLGIFEFGKGFMCLHILANAARQGCRVAILDGRGTSDVTSTVDRLLQSERISGYSISVLVNDSAGNPLNAASGDEITVSISIPVSEITCVPHGYLSGELSR